jgi:acyl-CoA hydrolase
MLPPSGRGGICVPAGAGGDVRAGPGRAVVVRIPGRAHVGACGRAGAPASGDRVTPRTGGPVLAYADGADSARLDPSVVAGRLGLEGPEVLLGWTLEPRPWLAEPSLRGRTVMAGYGLADAVAEGRIRYLPVRLSAVPALVESQPPAVAVVAGVRRGDGFAFRGTVGWGPAVAGVAGAVVVELDEEAPDLGGPPIPGCIVEVVARSPAADRAPPGPRAPEEVDLAIGRRVVSVLPPEPTVQLGPGGIAEGVVSSLDRPVRIWSGLVTDAMAGLKDRGLLVGQVTASYVWGGDPVAVLARDGGLRLRPVEETHDLTRVSAIPRFVSCNTALQVGLDGAVNVERVADRVVAGIGGHADFCAAGARSVGGMSLIALRSTDRRGRSTIVPRVAVVSTPRCDVDVVVTEHGIADLRGVDDAERARRIVGVASPAHRGWLEAAQDVTADAASSDR